MSNHNNNNDNNDKEKMMKQKFQPSAEALRITKALVAGRHQAGLPAGMPELPIEPLMVTRQALARAVQLRRPMLVHGPVGTGKTFAISGELDRLGVPWVYYNAEHKPKGNALLRALLSLLGEPVPASGPGSREEVLLARMSELARQHEFVIWVDEAQNLSVAALRHLRHVVDTPGVQATVVLSGDQTCRKTIVRNERPLWSRFVRRVEFRRIEAKDLNQVLSAYHPLFANTSATDLRRFDKAGPRGELRQWAVVLEAALDKKVPVAEGLTAKVFRLLRGIIGW